MTDLSNSEIQVQLAQMREQMKAIANTVEEIKVSVGSLLAIDRTVQQLLVHHECNKETQEVLSDRVGEVETAVAEGQGFLNKVRGAGVLLAFFQAAILAGAMWLISTVVTDKERLATLVHRVEQLEKANANPPPRH